MRPTRSSPDLAGTHARRGRRVDAHGQRTTGTAIAEGTELGDRLLATIERGATPRVDPDRPRVFRKTDRVAGIGALDGIVSFRAAASPSWWLPSQDGRPLLCGYRRDDRSDGH